MEKITAPTPKSIKDIPNVSVLANSRGKGVKSTAKMQNIVIRAVMALKEVMKPFRSAFANNTPLVLLAVFRLVKT